MTPWKLFSCFYFKWIYIKQILNLTCMLVIVGTIYFFTTLYCTLQDINLQAAHSMIFSGQFLCTVSTHPSTAGLDSDLDDLSCSGWEEDSGDGWLWPADTCSLSSGSDSEEGGCDSRAERSMNSSCHNLETDQRSNMSNKASEGEERPH